MVLHIVPRSIVQTVDKIIQFRQKKRTGHIDVWWLYDDGGLTLLLPHIIKTRRQFKVGGTLKNRLALVLLLIFYSVFQECKLRVFSLANKSQQLDLETRNLASMLSRYETGLLEVHSIGIQSMPSTGSG